MTFIMIFNHHTIALIDNFNLVLYFNIGTILTDISNHLNFWAAKIIDPCLMYVNAPLP